MQSLISNTTARQGGVAEPYELNDDYKSEITKMNLCKKSYLKTYEVVSEHFCFHPIRCNKFWCPDCGGLGGSLHKKRKRSIYDRVDFALESLRQLIFTVPEHLTGYFESRDMINKLGGVVNNVCKKYFPGRRMIGYFHCHGDKSNYRFHPHWNVHVVELRGTVLKIGREVLRGIKASYIRGLRGLLGVSGLKDIDVHYSFKDDIIKMKHAMKYMCRPVDERMIESDDDKIKELLVVEMKGFHYCRDWGCDLKKRKKKMVSLADDCAFDKTKFRFVGIVSAEEMETLLRESDGVLCERDDGAFEIRKKWYPKLKDGSSSRL